ncbi:hypothetical protein DV736_g2967, partial [Chaetothyriales sp. CBS 134916]
MAESRLLAPLDASRLHEHGLLTPGNSPGTYRLHKRRLNRSSDEEYYDIPLNTAPGSPAFNDAFSTIPVFTISRETLIYVGLSEEKASEMWNRWIHWPSTGPCREIDIDDGGLQVTFLDFIIGALENKVDAIEDNDFHWQACLDACGIDVDVQRAIMDPHFKHLRLSASCLYWVKDTIEMRYAGLKTFRDRRVCERWNCSERRLARVDMKEANHQQQSTPRIELDLWGSESVIAALNAPGYTVLFKGIDQGRIAGLFDDMRALDHIETLLSSPPSDFSGTRSLFYFTPNHQVAQYYAAYAKRRANCESIVILCLRIPNDAIESLTEADIQRIYWPSSEWKELVWRSRTLQPLPSHLRKYRRAVLVIGTISRKPDRLYHSMGSWKEVTEDCVLRVESSGQSNIGIQYVFSGEEDGHEFLVEHGARNISALPYPASQLEAWLAENDHNPAQS